MNRLIVFSGEYPVLSETFVWREVESIRESGVDVKVATLRQAVLAAANVKKADWILFGSGVIPTLFNSLIAILFSPKKSFKTLLLCIKTVLRCEEGVKHKLKILFQGYCAIGFAKKMEKFQPHWIHCHFAHAPATYAMFASQFLSVPWSFTGHANDLFQRRILLKEKLLSASKVACISKWHRDFYLSIAPVKPERLKVIRCGVDLAKNSDGELDANFSIVSVGRLIEKKGFHILLKACADLKEIKQNVTINIVGDGPEKKHLCKLAELLPTNIHVEFHGALPHAEILKLLQTVDLFVMPCIDDKNGDRDGIPVSMMEAMAAGVPVLSGDLPAIRELIDDGVTGWVKEVQPDIFRDSLKEILSDKKATRKVGQRARIQVEKEFSTSVNTKRLITMMFGENQ